MNELIKQLADNATHYADGVCDADPDAEWYATRDQKFAEMIVAECVQTLIDHTPVLFTNEVAEEDWDKGYDRAMKDCVHYIQEHFGVE
jgi:hypothetical protein